LVKLVPSDKLLVKLTPISLMKAVKNEVEVAGYKQALIRDAAALCEFLAWLEQTVNDGTSINETEAANMLRQIRE
jgi:Xaa-Pro aminopeptidase